MGANYTNSIIYTVKQRKMGPEQFQELVLSFSNTTQFFAFVRDPIDKFVSGSSQAVKEQNRNGKGGPCFKIEDAKEKMTCFLQKLKRQEIVDEHLFPMSVELYQMMMGQDVKVAIIPLSNMPLLLEYMGIHNFKSNGRKGKGYQE